MDAESVEEIKQNALAYFQAQSRMVTRDDIITRIYALPERYGNIGKSLCCTRRTKYLLQVGSRFINNPVWIKYIFTWI